MHILFRGQEYLVEEIEHDPVPRIRISMRVASSPPNPAVAGAPSGWLGGLDWDDGEPAAWEPAFECLGSEGEIIDGDRPRDPIALRKVLRAFLGGEVDSGIIDLQPCFYLSASDGPLHDLERSHPHGLVIHLFSTRGLAESWRDRVCSQADPGICVQECGDLEAFLTRRLKEGFAGADLDREEPIYFFEDEEGRLRFVKISSPGEDVVEPMVLGRRGQWYPYEGEIPISPYQEQSDCDRLMVERLGEQPFLGVEPEQKFYTIAGTLDEADIAEVWLDEPEGRVQVIALFGDPETSRAFLRDVDLQDAAVVPIDDLHAMVARAQQGRRRVVLHPGDHRARQADLWVDGSDVILDGYAGFWRLPVVGDFERA